MPWKRSGDKGGQATQPESVRIVEQLKACYCRLRVVNEQIRAQRSTNELSGSGSLLAEQQDLLQRVERLRGAALQEALNRELAGEPERLPGEIERLKEEIESIRGTLLNEISPSTIEGFLVKLLLVGARAGRDNAGIFLPPKLAECIPNALDAAARSEIRAKEEALRAKEIALDSGIGIRASLEASRLNLGAMAFAGQESGLDVEAGYFGPLYRNET